MSGKPSYNGVKKFRGIVERLVEAESKLDLAERDFQDAERRKRDYILETDSLRKELFALMEEMDVKSNGNSGYEGRASFFFAELYRQFKSELDEMHRVPVTED